MLKQPAPTPEPPSSTDERPDRLTIGRMLLLTAGIALGLALFAPRLAPGDLASADRWRETAFAVIAGLTIPAPLFAIRRRLRNTSLGAGGLFALAIGLGVWLLLPAAAIEYVARLRTGSDGNEVASCLYFVMPMIGLWYLVAGLVSGAINRRLFSPTTSWIDRFGFLLALLWSPLGAWHVVDVYRAVL
jgi:hypothetical protein